MAQVSQEQKLEVRNHMITFVKNHIKFNPADVFEIAEKSGQSPQDVVSNLNSGEADFDTIADIYEALTSMLNKKAEELKKNNSL